MLQYWHWKINQAGPAWQILHIHCTRVLSDLIMVKEWGQALAMAKEAGGGFYEERCLELA